MLNTQAVKIFLPRLAFKSEKNYIIFKDNIKVDMKSANSIKTEADFFSAAAVLVSSILNSTDTDEDERTNEFLIIKFVVIYERKQTHRLMKFD